MLEASQRNFSYNGAAYNGASTLSMVTSAVQGGAATTLFTSPNYNASGMLTAANLAVDPLSQQPKIGLTRAFDSRLRPISESDTHLPAVSSQPATVTVTVSGTEQSIAGTGTASLATGTITLSYTAPQVRRAIPLFVGSSITLPNGYRTSFVAPSNSAVGVANALTAALNVASSPVTAVVASGGTTSSASVTLTTKATGARQNGAIKLTLVSQVTAAPASMSGGGGATYDTGTVTVSFNGSSLTTTYGQPSTPDSVAAGLAAAINGAGLGFTATSVTPGALTVTANQPGPQYNGLPLSISSATDEPSLFSAPSFTGTSGTFAGGQDSTIYSYSIPSPGTATTGYAANGNLLSYTDTLNGTADAWNFAANGSPCYQPLNRITCANATAGPWGPVGSQPGLSLSWAYDSFGNRTTQTVSGSPSLPAPQTETAQFTTSNNHVTFATNAPNGFSYDNAGNVTDDGVNQYAYDAEGRLCAVLNKITQNKMGYAYDGLGNRVAKGTIGTFSCNMSPSGGNGFAATTNYIVGQGGEQLDELDGQGNGLHSNVYANGQLLATYVFSQSDWMYAFNDWLGTKRVTTNVSGTMTQTCQSLPFGDGLNCSGGIDPSEHHFTGKERDIESGNDDLGARYYSSNIGRMISPDPLMASAKAWDPQTWNRYAYARNNPLRYIDPTGMAEVTAAQCAKDKDCVTVNVNVIYDRNANGGQGLTDKQRASFEKNQLQNAKDQYGNADVHLNVTYRSGEINSNGGINGLEKGALNVFVTDSGGPESIDKGGYAASQVNVNSTNYEDLPHEMAHHLMGDMSSPLGRALVKDPTGISVGVDNFFTDVTNDSARLFMNYITPHLPNFPSGQPATVFNPQAREFQNRITPQTQPK